MLECVYSHIRTDKNSNITLHYRRLSKSKGNSKAAVAAASKLLKVVYWVLKDRRKYATGIYDNSNSRIPANHS